MSIPVLRLPLAVLALTGCGLIPPTVSPPPTLPPGGGGAPGIALSFVDCTFWARGVEYWDAKPFPRVAPLFRYGLLANDVYPDDTTAWGDVTFVRRFVLPGYRPVEDSRLYPSEQQMHETGFHSQVYLSSDKAQVVVAYEGTDFSQVPDLLANANVLPTWSGQERLAVDQARRVRQQYPRAEAIAVGHSLGGALALTVSAREKGVAAVAFNPSPNVKTSLRSRRNAVWIVIEEGDALDRLFKTRALGGRPGTRFPQAEVAVVDLMDGSAGMKDQHGMYWLARHLAIVSALRGDRDARRAVAANQRASGLSPDVPGECDPTATRDGPR